MPEVAHDPIPAETPCDIPASFFANLPATNWPLFLSAAAPHKCLTCHHDPGLHWRGAAQQAGPEAPAAVVAAAPDPLIRQGPAPALPLSPGETLRAVLSDWRSSYNVVLDDRERWEKLFSELTSLLFDPFSRVLIVNLEVTGSSATTRRWTLKEGISDEAIDQLSMALRAAKDLGSAIISLMRLEWRYRWRTLAAPLLMIDGEHELPMAIYVAEAILKMTPLSVPGARLPPIAVMQDPQYPHWWGILAATIPIETFITTLRDFFSEHTTAWAAKAENKGMVISAAAFRTARARRAADEAHAAATAAVLVTRPPQLHVRADGERSGRSRSNRHVRKRSRQEGETQGTSENQHSATPQSAGFLLNSRGGGRGRGRRGGRGRFSSDSGGRTWRAPEGVKQEATQ